MSNNAQLMCTALSFFVWQNFVSGKSSGQTQTPQPSSTALRNKDPKTRPAGALRGQTEGYIA